MSVKLLLKNMEPLRTEFVMYMYNLLEVQKILYRENKPGESTSLGVLFGNFAQLHFKSLHSITTCNYCLRQGNPSLALLSIKNVLSVRLLKKTKGL